MDYKCVYYDKQFFLTDAFIAPFEYLSILYYIQFLVLRSTFSYSEFLVSVLVGKFDLQTNTQFLIRVGELFQKYDNLCWYQI